jgi:hypothetical protein
LVWKAGVAQSVEQLIRNEKVGCSIHLSGTNQNNKKANLTRVGFSVSAFQHEEMVEQQVIPQPGRVNP